MGRNIAQLGAVIGRSFKQRLLELGASSVRTWVIGNIKFDIELDDNLPAAGQAVRDELFGKRPVWVAASTHEAEEEAVLQLYKEALGM